MTSPGEIPATAPAVGAAPSQASVMRPSVAGDTASGANGDVAALRAEPVAAEVATVDGIETGPGQVAAALALIHALQSPGGAFGASGADGAAPGCS